MVSDGTSQTTIFGRLGLRLDSAVNTVSSAFTAMNVLPPAVGTLAQMCGTPGTVFL